ncbi:MAG: phosphate acyltransferase PlsX [Coriobacteriales bacterium]|jgi:glycerol-3-phosphate acyltransferase PlsX|nr:phosphate acyltransferase PlsX [Coriobacteriales bacterium]
MLTIALDVMGGDDAPQVVLEGARHYLDDASAADLSLVGPPDLLRSFVESLAPEQAAKVKSVPASEQIGFDEHPADAVRRKPDSSIVVAAKLIKDGLADVFFSAGSTGAVMAAATLFLRRVKGVSRPAIATLIPTRKAPVLMLDSGANADVKPEYLVDFCILAEVYCRELLGRPKPRIALLNIGEEASKGSELYQKAHRLLKANPAFIGNIEGRDLFSGDFDAFVCDGFSGNVVLKTIEGTAGFMMHELKDGFKSSLRTKLGAALALPALKPLKAKMSAEVAGAAPLLGVRGNVLIGHGSSSAAAIYYGLKQSAALAEAKLAAKIEAAFNGR